MCVVHVCVHTSVCVCVCVICAYIWRLAKYLGCHFPEESIHHDFEKGFYHSGTPMILLAGCLES